MKLGANKHCHILMRMLHSFFFHKSSLSLRDDPAVKIMHNAQRLVADASILTWVRYSIAYLLLLVLTLKVQVNPCQKQSKTRKKIIIKN